MNTLKNIKELSKIISTSKKYIITYILLSLLISIIGLATPLLSALQLVNLTNGLWEQTIIYTIFFFFITIFQSIINFIIAFCTEKFSKIIIRQLQLDIANEILKIKIEHIDKHSNGLFIQRMTNDATSLANIFTFGVDNITSLIVI